MHTRNTVLPSIPALHRRDYAHLLCTNTMLHQVDAHTKHSAALGPLTPRFRLFFFLGRQSGNLPKLGWHLGQLVHFSNFLEDKGPHGVNQNGDRTVALMRCNGTRHGWENEIESIQSSHHWCTHLEPFSRCSSDAYCTSCAQQCTVRM